MSMEVTEVRWHRLQGHAMRLAGGHGGRAEFFRRGRLLGSKVITYFPACNRLLHLVNDANNRGAGVASYIPGGWRYLAKPGRTLTIPAGRANTRRKGEGMQVEWILYQRQPDGRYRIDFGTSEKMLTRIRTRTGKVRQAMVDLVRKAIDEGKGRLYPQLTGWYFACPEGQTIEVPLKRRKGN